MLIKFTNLTDDFMDKNERYPGKLVTGTRVDSGEEVKRKFFANNQRLMAEISEFGFGDVINMRMVKKPKGWEIQSFEEADPQVVEAVSNKASAPQSAPEQSNAKSSGSYSKGSSWNGRTGEAYDRSAAVYLAFDLIKTTRSAASLSKTGADAIFDEMMKYAEKINAYIHTGDVGTPAWLETDDPLSPPELD
jgi:hypothetical protein